MLMLNIMLHKISGLDTDINHDVKREYSKGEIIVKLSEILYVTGFTKIVLIGTRNEIHFIADY